MSKRLETNLEPILNPQGPNKIVTQEVIDALSSIFKNPLSSELAKECAQNLIDRIKRGYEIQTGEKYDSGS